MLPVLESRIEFYLDLVRLCTILRNISFANSAAVRSGLKKRKSGKLFSVLHLIFSFLSNLFYLSPTGLYKGSNVYS